MAWAKPKRSTEQRGYGTAHRAERARRVARTTPLTPCGSCGKPLGPDTSRWHIPHNDTRTDYLPGMWCVTCNIRDGRTRDLCIHVVNSTRLPSGSSTTHS